MKNYEERLFDEAVEEYVNYLYHRNLMGVAPEQKEVDDHFTDEEHQHHMDMHFWKMAGILRSLAVMQAQIAKYAQHLSDFETEKYECKAEDDLFEELVTKAKEEYEEEMK